MAERRPDGVKTEPPLKPGEFREEPGRDPASSRPATPAAALNSIGSFPAGLKAIESLDDEARVRICNLTLKAVRFDRVTGPQALGKKQVIQQKLEPFEVIELSAAEARVVLAHQEARAVRRPSPVLIVVGNYKGDCGNKKTFQAHGRTFKSCPYHDCPQSDHAEQAYSVWQSQHFLRTMKTPEAIDRFTTSFDLRNDVISLANYERRAREKAHREEQMQTATAARDAEAVY